MKLALSVAMLVGLLVAGSIAASGQVQAIAHAGVNSPDYDQPFYQGDTVDVNTGHHVELTGGVAGNPVVIYYYFGETVTLPDYSTVLLQGTGDGQYTQFAYDAVGEWKEEITLDAPTSFNDVGVYSANASSSISVLNGPSASGSDSHPFLIEYGGGP